MFLSNADKELISKLKGRISKALNIQTSLSREERACMEGLYNTIDEVILGNEKYNETGVLKETLIGYSTGLKNSKRKFIKEHIIPLVTKIATKKWRTK